MCWHSGLQKRHSRELERQTEQATREVAGEEKKVGEPGERIKEVIGGRHSWSGA
jgi:hypothetical protein